MGNDKVHDKETHGTSNDIDEMTPIDKVKAPDLFHRAKEEVEALVDHLRSKKESDNNQIEKEEKASNLEKIVSMVTQLQDHQEIVHKETHGTSNNIDESTNIDEVKAPNLFERAKEEIQAVVHSIQSRKEVKKELEDTKSTGFWEFLGGILQKCCSPSNSKRD